MVIKNELNPPAEPSHLTFKAIWAEGWIQAGIVLGAVLAATVAAYLMPP